MNIYKIVPGLYIGDMSSPAHEIILQQNRITHILTVYTQDQDEIQDDPDEKYQHLKIVCPDDIYADVTEHFTRCFGFIHPARLHGSVLVRCANGMSESVAVATAYLGTITRIPWENVLTYIEQKVSFASLNFGFRIRLGRFQTERIADERRNLVESFQVVDAFGDTSLIEATDKYAVFEI